jgi:hypothetical protein
MIPAGREGHVDLREDVCDERNGIGAPPKFFGVPDEARKPGIASNLRGTTSG